jgi:two-component system, cell cycle sensor histidine kinase and response regulator CckA
VSDTGVGMSDDVRAHVFEPFFTTKEIGQGTGLGLAMIHGAVSQNGGSVDVSSELGRGTTFRILLPRVSDAVNPGVPTAGTPNLPRGTETVLLVEDDTRVRDLMLRLLERQGYTVLGFRGGSVLLEWLATASQPVHLLLTDVMMPGMNGKELAEQVRTMRPGIRVLFASGYTADVVLQQGAPLPGVDFLPKPFTAASLSTAVRALLDAPSPA